MMRCPPLAQFGQTNYISASIISDLDGLQIVIFQTSQNLCSEMKKTM